jgi:hypothetical protein
MCPQNKSTTGSKIWANVVLKLREKGWIVILRQVIPTSPLSQLTALDMRLLGPVILVTITKMDIRHKQNT